MPHPGEHNRTDMEIALKGILAFIESAFNAVERPSTSLAQYKLIDEKGMLGTITPEEWEIAHAARPDRRWQDLTDEEIEACDCQLAHMDAQSFRYYLPAYMAYAARHAGDSIFEYEIGEFTIYSLSWASTFPGYKEEKFSLLDPAQKCAITAFLGFVVEHADEYIRDDAQKALDQWLRA
jgi:hypothetical protein